MKDSKLDGTPIILFGQSAAIPFLFYAVYSRSNNYVHGLLREDEIIDENNNALTLDQIHDSINNVDLTEVIQKLSQTLTPITIHSILKHPKVTETHKRLIKMYSKDMKKKLIML